MGTHPPASFDACLYDNGQLKQSTNVAAALWHETVVCLSVVQHMHTSMIQKIQNTETPDIDLYHLLYVIDMCIDHKKISSMRLPHAWLSLVTPSLHKSVISWIPNSITFHPTTFKRSPRFSPNSTKQSSTPSTNYNRITISPWI